MFEAKLESYLQLVVLRKWKKFFETLQFLSINSWNSPFKIRKKKKKSSIKSYVKFIISRMYLNLL